MAALSGRRAERTTGRPAGSRTLTPTGWTDQGRPREVRPQMRQRRIGGGGGLAVPPVNKPAVNARSRNLKETCPALSFASDRRKRRFGKKQKINKKERSIIKINNMGR